MNTTLEWLRNSNIKSEVRKHGYAPRNEPTVLITRHTRVMTSRRMLLLSVCAFSSRVRHSNSCFFPRTYQRVHGVKVVLDTFRRRLGVSLECFNWQESTFSLSLSLSLLGDLLLVHPNLRSLSLSLSLSLEQRVNDSFVLFLTTTSLSPIASDIFHRRLDPKTQKSVYLPFPA